MLTIGAVKTQVMSKPDTALVKPIPSPADNQESPGRKSQQITRQKMEHIAAALNIFLESVQTDLEIRIHSETSRIIIKVVSKEDGKVIREIPSEELLNLVAKIDEMIGALFHSKA